MGGGAFAEQAAFDVGNAGDDFVTGLFEIGEFSDEGEDLRGIAGVAGRISIVMDGPCRKKENAILRW